MSRGEFKIARHKAVFTAHRGLTPLLREIKTCVIKWECSSKDVLIKKNSSWIFFSEEKHKGRKSSSSHITLYSCTLKAMCSPVCSHTSQTAVMSQEGSRYLSSMSCLTFGETPTSRLNVKVRQETEKQK